MLNKVKVGSNMYEFINFTWNVVKGKCPHDCCYCLDGDTLILLADLSFKKLREIQVGEKVMGITKTSKYSKLSSSVVINKSQKKDFAYRINTPDTSVICSSDHKWLIDRGRWRSIIDGLNKGRNIKQVNKFSYEETPKDNDYKKGYLRGIIFGDGTMGKYISKEQKIIRNGKEYIYSPKEVFKFRLSMQDNEAILRAKEYLSYFGIDTFDHIHEGLFSIRKDGQESYYKLLRLLEPIDNCSFKAGYLGGIFDAEGSFSEGALRIHNRYLFECKSYLEYFGFKINLACHKHSDVHTITINGGLNEHIRFFSISQSAITRKRYRFLKAIKTGYSKILSCEGIGLRDLYDIQTSTENFIANGLVSHNCYMKRFPQKDLWFDNKELKTDLGKDNFIFIGSSCDMFADVVPNEWITKTLHHAMQFKNTYLLQTKNPERIADFFGVFPEKVIIGTTIETNRNTNAKCPSPKERAKDLAKFGEGFRKMVTIEPIMDFDVKELVKMIKSIKPEFVNVGADSKNHNLQEPSKEKIIKLIEELKNFTEVKVKDNLNRLIGEEV